MPEITFACRTCGSSATHPFVSASDLNQRHGTATFEYRQCAQCMSIFLDCLPADLGDYYATDYPPYTARLSTREQLYTARMEQAKLEIVRRHAKGPGLIEIGPAKGRFLSLAKSAGFEVRGIEQDRACVEYIRNKLSIEAIQTADPAASLGELPEACDVLCAWHVVEHLADLPALVSAAATRVRRESGIVVFSTPNPFALSFRCFGKYWVHLDAPRHLNLIPPAALNSLMASHGFQQVMLQYDDEVGLHLNRMGWRNSLENRLAGWRFPRWLGKLLGKILSMLMAPFERAEGLGAAYTVVYRLTGPTASPGTASSP